MTKLRQYDDFSKRSQGLLLATIEDHIVGGAEAETHERIRVPAPRPNSGRFST